jgi:hypothetical protein
MNSLPYPSTPTEEDSCCTVLTEQQIASTLGYEALRDLQPTWNQALFHLNGSLAVCAGIG